MPPPPKKIWNKIQRALIPSSLWNNQPSKKTFRHLQKKLVFFLLLLQVISAMRKNYKLITQFMEKVNPEIFY